MCIRDRYSALGADRLNLRDEHNRIDQRSFDTLMERFLSEDGATFVVDNGASTFLPLWHYLLENNALDYLRQQGRRVYVHTVITGGQALIDTLNGFNELAQTTQGRNIVVSVSYTHLDVYKRQHSGSAGSRSDSVIELSEWRLDRLSPCKNHRALDEILQFADESDA